MTRWDAPVLHYCMALLACGHIFLLMAGVLVNRPQDVHGRDDNSDDEDNRRDHGCVMIPVRVCHLDATTIGLVIVVEFPFPENAMITFTDTVDTFSGCEGEINVIVPCE